MTEQGSTPRPPTTATGLARRTPTREAPPRPSTTSPNAPPVLVKLTPPFAIRLSQVFWILSFAIGGFTLVFYFVIRQELLPLISEVVEEVTAGRSDETYTTAADIVFWTVFGLMVIVLGSQVTMLVSFMARKPKTRWWQLASFGLQIVLVLLSTEWVALGDRRQSLLLLLTAQAGLVLLALLSSVLPGGIAWSARRLDVRRGQEGVVGGDDL